MKRAGIVEGIRADPDSIETHKRFWREPERGAGHGWRFCECLKYRPQSSHRDPARGLRQHLGFGHGFPLIRSLRASAQRSTSVLFSSVLSVDCGRTIHDPATKNDSSDGKRFVVRADQKLTAFVELEKGDSHVRGEFDRVNLHHS